MSKVANYGLIIITPPLKPDLWVKYQKTMGLETRLSHPLHTPCPFNQGKRQKPSGKNLPLNMDSKTNLKITYPITVSKPNQIKIKFSFVEDPMSPCYLNKVKDPFGCSTMDVMRLIHVYWSHTYYIRNIRSSVCKVKQTPNQLPIQCIIYYLP